MGALVPHFVVSIALLLLINTSASDEDFEINTKFSYIGASGPHKWGSLHPSFSVCSDGQSQSPVDIVKGKVVLNKNLKVLKRIYRPSNATLASTGHAVGIHTRETGGVMILDKKQYHLQQMHWHSPSEHLIDGVQYPAELHLVHKANDGNISVVGILYQLGKPDPLLTKINLELGELAKEASAKHGVAEVPIGKLNFKQLRRSNGKYYRYIGSLTTPPCAENVIWHVLDKVRTITKEQVEALRAPLNWDCKSNSRPVQQLNGRCIELYDD